MNAGDISQIEPNIDPGIKHIRFVIDQYYNNEPMDRLNKTLFAFASYNAGPARIRHCAPKQGGIGLDRKICFNNVERVASVRIGRETVQYVSNIYSYYVAYQLAWAEWESRKGRRASMRFPAESPERSESPDHRVNGTTEAPVSCP